MHAHDYIIIVVYCYNNNNICIKKGDGYTWGVIHQIPILVGVDEGNKVKKMKGYQKEGRAVGPFSFAGFRTLSYGPLSCYIGSATSPPFLCHSCVIPKSPSSCAMMFLLTHGHGSHHSPHPWNIMLRQWWQHLEVLDGI